MSEKQPKDPNVLKASRELRTAKLAALSPEAASNYKQLAKQARKTKKEVREAQAHVKELKANHKVVSDAAKAILG